MRACVQPGMTDSDAHRVRRIPRSVSRRCHRLEQVMGGRLQVVDRREMVVGRKRERMVGTSHAAPAAVAGERWDEVSVVAHGRGRAEKRSVPEQAGIEEMRAVWGEAMAHPSAQDKIEFVMAVAGVGAYATGRNLQGRGAAGTSEQAPVANSSDDCAHRDCLHASETVLERAFAPEARIAGVTGLEHRQRRDGDQTGAVPRVVVKLRGEERVGFDHLLK